MLKETPKDTQKPMNHLAVAPHSSIQPIKHPITNLKSPKYPENPIAITPITHRFIHTFKVTIKIMKNR